MRHFCLFRMQIVSNDALGRGQEVEVHTLREILVLEDETRKNTSSLFALPVRVAFTAAQ